MTDLILFWHRRDLRISDNLGLAAARDRTAKVIGVFCLDPTLLEDDAIAPARVVYMIGCLAELQQRYRSAGSRLLIVKGEPKTAIPSLAKSLSAQAVYWNWDVEPYAQSRDQAVREALKAQGIGTHNTWDQLLHGPGEVRTNAGDPYTVYTPFWRNWIDHAKAAPTPTPQNLEDLSTAEAEAATAAGVIELPGARDLGFVWHSPLPLAPGEQAARDQLANFCREDRAIAGYDDQRNFPGVEGTSLLSAALKFGAVGIRTVWEAADTAYSRCRSDETRRGVRTWQQELAWREFYQHVMYFSHSSLRGLIERR